MPLDRPLRVAMTRRPGYLEEARIQLGFKVRLLEHAYDKRTEGAKIDIPALLKPIAQALTADRITEVTIDEYNIDLDLVYLLIGGASSAQWDEGVREQCREIIGRLPEFLSVGVEFVPIEDWDD